MKMRLIIALAMALMLVATLALPAVAIDEQSRQADIDVGEIINITLSGPGAIAIAFPSVQPGQLAEASGQSDGVPAITVEVGPDTNTNVSISIKGTPITGSLVLNDWKYCKTHAGTKVGLTNSYVEVYPSVSKSTSNPFYHWVDVPSSAVSGLNSVTISYKATAVTP